MAKNCVITVDPEVLDKASTNAQRHGKSLKDVIEDAIIDMAETEDEGKWLTDKALEEVPWAPSRVALWGMRSSGRLKEGKHYKKNGRFLYYNEEELKKELAPVAGTTSPATI